MRIDFKNLTLFRSADTGMAIETVSLDKQSANSLNKPISPLILDQETADTLQSTSEIGGGFFYALSSGSFILSFLLGAAME